MAYLYHDAAKGIRITRDPPGRSAERYLSVALATCLRAAHDRDSGLSQGSHNFTYAQQPEFHPSHRARAFPRTTSKCRRLVDIDCPHHASFIPFASYKPQRRTIARALQVPSYSKRSHHVSGGLVLPSKLTGTQRSCPPGPTVKAPTNASIHLRAPRRLRSHCWLVFLRPLIVVKIHSGFGFQLLCSLLSIGRS